METEIRKILKRGIITLVSILLMVAINAYLNHLYKPDIMLEREHTKAGLPADKGLNINDVSMETANSSPSAVNLIQVDKVPSGP